MGPLILKRIPASNFLEWSPTINCHNLYLQDTIFRIAYSLKAIWFFFLENCFLFLANRGYYALIISLLFPCIFSLANCFMVAKHCLHKFNSMSKYERTCTRSVG